MSQTQDSDSGHLSQEELDELKARFLAAVERGGPPIVLSDPVGADRRARRVAVVACIALVLVCAAWALTEILWP